LSDVISRGIVVDEPEAWKTPMVLLFWRCREAVRLGWVSYRANNPIRVVAMTSAPRIALQCIFFALIGRLLDGPAGERYAFIGCVAFASLTSTLVAICDVPMEDLWNETYFRLQRGVIPPALVYACRVIPMVLEGFVESVLVLVVCGPLLGLGRLSLSVAPYLPLYLLVTITSAMGGLAVAGIAVGKRKDVLLGNLAAYVVLAAGAIVAPLPASAQWLGIIGDIVPARHGVQAIRSALAGGPWLAQTLLEGIVGLCWLAVAISVITRSNRRIATQ
jgi:ABC-2 type transport system permease protein